MEEIISKLDLDAFIAQYKSFLSREKSLFIHGDTNIHFRFLKALQKHDLSAPPQIENLDAEIIHLSRQGVLHIKQIWEFIKIVRYFLYLKQQKFEGFLLEWAEKIDIPHEILEINLWFDKDANLKEETDERFGLLNQNLNIVKEKINSHLRELLKLPKLREFLVDSQIHFINSQETLLLRGGYNNAIKGWIAARSGSGYFYVAPNSLDELKKQESELIAKKEELIYEYCKKISSIFSKHILFLRFINKEFDRFDSYLSRVMLAKRYDMDFVLPNKDTAIILKEFSHPALTNPKPVSVNFQKNILLITGVNAGGKTMLMKSILSAAFLAKYLLPMKINSANSQIGSFKNIKAIAEDPQNAKNDISTFAGRMLEFGKLFIEKNALVGVDEIELGTDADEAANLFCAILENLIKRDVKIVITTHHKRLAAMLSHSENIELLAAIYDEKIQRPTFTFLEGTIGKSYAFETAARYGIAQNIIERARFLYGEDKEKLNELIQKNIDLELESRRKLKELETKERALERLSNSIKTNKEEQEAEFFRLKNRFEREYDEAISLAKEAAREKESANIHKLLNKANKAKSEIFVPKPQISEEFRVGDRVKYGNLKGVIISLKKEFARVEIDGVTMYLPQNVIKKTAHIAPKIQPKNILTLQRETSYGVVLDLHGLRMDEAVEKMDKFLSDALINGFDEVQIYHGVGTGKLAYAVKNFLKTHPSVKDFFDAPANKGGAGATIVRL